jgi:hypothetical protein
LKLQKLNSEKLTIIQLVYLCYGFSDTYQHLRSRSRKEPHNLVGAGAVTRCHSGTDGSGSDNGIKHG